MLQIVETRFTEPTSVVKMLFAENTLALDQKSFYFALSVGEGITLDEFIDMLESAIVKLRAYSPSSSAP
jgi:hypothetical protein